MELRLALLVVAASMPAVAGFQAAMRVGAMQPAMAARAPSTAMLVDPAMLDTSAIVEAPTQLLALKSEADLGPDVVHPVLLGLGARRDERVQHRGRLQSLVVQMRLRHCHYCILVSRPRVGGCQKSSYY